MTTRDKLIDRFCSLPKDFTFDELKRLFKMFGFETSNKGATSGSRVEFINKERDMSYIAHKPHPLNIIKGYVMKQVLSYLKVNGFIK